MDIISYDWTNNFEEFFASYFSNGDDSRIVIILYYNNYISPHDLETPVFEGDPNRNNYSSFHNLQSPVPKSYSNKESQILSSKNDLFTGLFNLNLKKS